MEVVEIEALAEVVVEVVVEVVEEGGLTSRAASRVAGSQRQMLKEAMMKRKDRLRCAAHVAVSFSRDPSGK